MAGKGNVLKPKPIEVEAEEIVEEEPKLEKKIRQRRDKSGKIEKNAKPNDQSKGIIHLIHDERTRKITGLFFILLSVFLLIAFTSYFFTWKSDQSLVTGSWFDLLRYSDKHVDNWLGKFGAISSHQFMHTWFGISSYCFVLLIFLPGFRILFNEDVLPYKKRFAIAYLHYYIYLLQCHSFLAIMK